MVTRVTGMSVSRLSTYRALFYARAHARDTSNNDNPSHPSQRAAMDADAASRRTKEARRYEQDVFGRRERWPAVVDPRR
jgi:hypothetical protein